MALSKTYFETKGRDITNPIPDTPGYVPPVVPTPVTPDPGSVPDIPRPVHTGTVECKLYINSSENNKLVKDIELIRSYELMLKKNTDLVNPMIELTESRDLSDINYMLFNGKYYFVNSIECVTGNIWKIIGHVDVLSTYKDDLAFIPCIIDREEPHNDLYIDGGTYVKGTKNYGVVYNFSSGFNSSPENILICCGGD